MISKTFDYLQVFTIVNCSRTKKFYTLVTLFLECISSFIGFFSYYAYRGGWVECMLLSEELLL